MHQKCYDEFSLREVLADLPTVSSGRSERIAIAPVPYGTKFPDFTIFRHRADRSSEDVSYRPRHNLHAKMHMLQ